MMIVRGRNGVGGPSKWGLLCKERICSPWSKFFPLRVDPNCFSEKIRPDVSSESSARQRIHMKNQALFSSKDKRKKLKCRLLQFLFGALRITVQLQ